MRGQQNETARLDTVAPEATAVLGMLAAQHATFLRFATSRLGDEGVARDVLQATYVRAIERLPSLRDPGKAVAWFYRLLRHAVADAQRARGIERSRHGGDDERLDEVPADDGDDEGACCCGVALVPRLAATHAEVIARVDLEGGSVADVAASLGITPNALGVRLHRARHALREALATYCGTDAVRACGTCGCARPG